MAASGNMGKTMEHVKTLLGNVSGLTAARVKIGIDDQGDSDEFFKDIAEAGPMVIIKPPKFKGLADHQKTTSFDIEIKLFFGYPNNQDYDYIPIIDLWQSIISELCDISNYASASGVSIPLDISSFEMSGEEIKQDPRVSLSKTTVSFKGII